MRTRFIRETYLKETDVDRCSFNSSGCIGRLLMDVSMIKNDSTKISLHDVEPLRTVLRYFREPSIAKKDFTTWLFRTKIQSRKLHKLGAQSCGNEDVVVSLTSFGERLGYVYLTVLSLMHQTMPPDRIVLWIDVDTDPATVPDSLKRLEPYGLDIRYGCENLKGHKKYFWALREFSDSCVITVDDDVMYPADTVESLMAAHANYPEAVVGRRVHRMLLSDGELAPYVDWDQEWSKDGRPRRDLLATGIGGILYPPHCFGEKAFDLNPILDTGLGNDDIWLKANEVIYGRDVAWVPCDRVLPYKIVEDLDSGLCIENVLGGENDRHIHAIEEATGIDFADCVR